MFETYKIAKYISEKSNFFPRGAAATKPQISAAAAAACVATRPPPLTDILVKYSDRLLQSGMSFA